ncbi:hypothetical protein Q5P01_003711 [Channa striata]|uniref:Uncharacterized protein n=1 Tax=Channa striata TaxID=64152 RepID=A0AA88NK21_CHASR|nr:hypothetical protein Q5P01_003711 [Channa striata]
MPRKAPKTEKPPLLFVERPLRGAKLQNVPEVRAALNPKDFFTETQTHNSSALNSWVSPQFDSSLLTVLPVRRGRRRCQSATSALDSCSQLSRKNSVCKFPSLSFHKGPKEQFHHPKRTSTKKTSVVSNTGNQPQGSCQIKRTVSHTNLDTPKRQSVSVTKRNVEKFSDRAASSSRYVNRPEIPLIQETKNAEFQQTVLQHLPPLRSAGSIRHPMWILQRQHKMGALIFPSPLYYFNWLSHAHRHVACHLTFWWLTHQRGTMG